MVEIIENNIAGKVVIVTGASSGLGEATARLLAQKGAKVILTARRQAQLDAIAAEITAQGGEALAIPSDVTKLTDLQSVVAKALDLHGKLDVAINNAGLMAIAPLSELKVDEWNRMIDINIRGVLHGIAAALPVFLKQGSGHFINISSVVGRKVFAPGGTVYSGTKFAVGAISEGLRVEVGPNIRTTTIEPGVVDTELKHGTSHSESAAGIHAFYEIAIPADAIARAIVYAIEQPANVDVNEIVVRPTAQEL
ncbi:MAG: SDR family oxidoreductase [Cyanothece sp. SIO1E1]|nr:SDR family oxidoreductase [Cyanothece sp. SIO1E1]